MKIACTSGRTENFKNHEWIYCFTDAYYFENKRVCKKEGTISQNPQEGWIEEVVNLFLFWHCTAHLEFNTTRTTK